MGSATDPVPHLNEVGLCGSHAYSITDARVVRTASGAERLLRIRNPHGVGEWNGDWSDKSAKWAQLVDADPSMVFSPRGSSGRGGVAAATRIVRAGPKPSRIWTGSSSRDHRLVAAQVKRTGDDDGTFWMDYTHFLMGFSRVDVCVAPPQFHARSFANQFPIKKTAWRVARNCYKLRGSGTIFAMALQPTKRGAWCRSDRKKSYRDQGGTSTPRRRRDPPRRTVHAAAAASPRSAATDCRSFQTTDDSRAGTGRATCRSSRSTLRRAAARACP